MLIRLLSRATRAKSIPGQALAFKARTALHKRVIIQCRQFSTAPTTHADNTTPNGQPSISIEQHHTKLVDMNQSAERFIDKLERFEQASDILIGAVVYANKYGVSDASLLSTTHLNLALCYQYLSDFEKALINYEQGFKHLGNVQKHTDMRYLGLRYLSYAELLSYRGRHEDAVSACRSAIAAFEESEGNNELVGFALSNLASYLYVLEKVEEAVSTNEKALDVLEHCLGRNNAQTHMCAANLSNLYSALRRDEDIEKLDKRFQEPELAVTPRASAAYPSSFLNGLKEKWEKAGYRNVLDPPGLHRSSALATQTYAAFFDEWRKSNQKLEPYYRDIIKDELESISYAVDKLTPWAPQPYSVDGKEVQFSDNYEQFKSKYAGMQLPKPVTRVHDIMLAREKELARGPEHGKEERVTAAEEREVVARREQFRRSLGKHKEERKVTTLDNNVQENKEEDQGKAYKRRQEELEADLGVEIPVDQEPEEEPEYLQQLQDLDIYDEDGSPKNRDK